MLIFLLFIYVYHISFFPGNVIKIHTCSQKLFFINKHNTCKTKKRFTYDNEGLMQIIKTLVKKNNLYLWPGNNG